MGGPGRDSVADNLRKAITSDRIRRDERSRMIAIFRRCLALEQAARDPLALALAQNSKLKFYV